MCIYSIYVYMYIYVVEDAIGTSYVIIVVLGKFEHKFLGLKRWRLQRRSSTRAEHSENHLFVPRNAEQFDRVSHKDNASRHLDSIQIYKQLF